MEDVGDEVPEENDVLVAVDIQLPVQTHLGGIDMLGLALPIGQFPGILEECLPFDGLVVVRSEQRSIVL